MIKDFMSSYQGARTQEDAKDIPGVERLPGDEVVFVPPTDLVASGVQREVGCLRPVF